MSAKKQKAKNIILVTKMLILKVCPKKSNITKAPVAMKVGAVEAHADVFQLHIHGLELVFDSPAQGNDMFFFHTWFLEKYHLKNCKLLKPYLASPRSPKSTPSPAKVGHVIKIIPKLISRQC